MRQAIRNSTIADPGKSSELRKRTSASIVKKLR